MPELKNCGAIKSDDAPTTTDKATPLELAARCEAATGPELELDLAISRIRGPDGTKCLPQEYYTASLDAAMTLVPEGWRVIRIEQVRSDEPTQVALMEQGGNSGYVRSIGGKTWPLALCAAALKARASQ